MKKLSWIGALLGAALVGAITASAVAPLFAQAPQGRTSIVTTPDGKVISETTPREVILSGDDLAIRVDRSEKGRVVGVLVVKVNGEWVPVQLSDFNALAR